LDLEPKEQFDVVIYGHSHIPANELRDGVLFFNPGSAGPRRFDFPIAVGVIVVDKGTVSSEIIEITPKI
jgi:hypothetical protein